MGVLSLLVSLATILSISLQVSGLHVPNLIRQSVDDSKEESSCLSWRFGVETHSVRDWQLVPKVCGDYVENYFKSGQYDGDSKAVISQALSYAKSLDLAGDGKDIWIFAMEETALSNLPFFAENGFGTTPVEKSKLTDYLQAGKSPALPESLTLYRSLLSIGIKVVFLVERIEVFQSSTETNLKTTGYDTWEKIVFWDWGSSHLTHQEFKSTKRRELVESGYRIVGNIGAQWSDLLGPNAGNRTFKLPNPMYYSP